MDIKQQRLAALARQETNTLQGTKTVEKRRLRRALRTLLDLNVEPSEIFDNPSRLSKFMTSERLTIADMVALGQIDKAVFQQDTRAAEYVRDTVGEKPRDEVVSYESGLSNMSDEDLEEILTKIKGEPTSE